MPQGIGYGVDAFQRLIEEHGIEAVMQAGEQARANKQQRGGVAAGGPSAPQVTGSAAQPIPQQAPDPGSLYSDRSDIYDRFSRGTDEAFEASRAPYQASTGDKVLQYGGMAAILAALLGVGGKSGRRALATGGAHALSSRLGAPSRDRASKAATLDNTLSQLTTASNASLGESRAQEAGYRDARDRFEDVERRRFNEEGRTIQQGQFDRTLADRQAARDAAVTRSTQPSAADASRTRKEHAGVVSTGGKQGGKRFTEPLRATILSEVAAREPAWWRGTTTDPKTGKSTGVKPTFQQAQKAYQAGDIGTVPREDNFFSADVPAHEDEMLAQLFGRDYPQAEADSAQYQQGYVQQNSPYATGQGGPQPGGITPELTSRGVTTPQAAIAYLKSLNLSEAEYNQALRDNGLAR